MYSLDGDGYEGAHRVHNLPRIAATVRDRVRQSGPGPVLSPVSVACPAWHLFGAHEIIIIIFGCGCQDRFIFLRIIGLLGKPSLPLGLPYSNSTIAIFFPLQVFIFM